MATKPWIKLDWDWAESPEAELLRKRYGSKALLGWIQLMILMAEFGGALNLEDEMQMEQAMKRMRRGEPKVRELVERCAECGLIDDACLRMSGRASSARAVRDARAREGRIEVARAKAEAVNSRRNASSGISRNCGKRGGMTPLNTLLPGA